MTPSEGGDCGDNDLCTASSPYTTSAGTLFSLSPFIATFVVVSLVVSRKVFPHLSRIQNSSHGGIDDGEDHILPATAPPSLQQAHAEYGSRRTSLRRRVAAVTFSATIGLSTVLAELILAEISDSHFVNSHARNVALGITVPTLLFMLIVLIPFLEVQSVIAGLGFRSFSTGKGKGKGRWCTGGRVALVMQMVAFGGWLFAFWSLGRAVPEGDYLYGAAGGVGGGGFDSTGMTIGRASLRSDSVGELFDGGRLSRACLERIGVIGISLMALLSGFASVSTPWHFFSDNRSYKRRPITDADIARKQAGLDATNEMLVTKRHRLRSLQRKLAMASEDTAQASRSAGLVGKMFTSIKGMAGGGGSDAAEIKALQLEISGLETMETNLRGSLNMLKTRQAAHARDGTILGKVLAVPSYAFSVYCIYRILATTLTTLRRMAVGHATFSSSDPINRFLGLLAKHWDPKLDQMAWARQISFLLSGVILAASANSVLQTFHIFAKWAPGLLYQAQANLALLIGQIAATYVISSALLLRSNLPRDVGRSVGDHVLESALEPGFVDRWFEGWFLIASIATAVGIWVGRKLGGGGGDYYDDWDEFAGEEMGQKRS
ncbi:putative g protein-coupled receptor protein [Diplogelasinospora grovesii]|uniref:G protein-coupled receptor protein n=1 Tax=Diplogelasinospora grovesii TaxID=303347 RepID=A0AAN6N701_9PEZI|nr:putative g protein-coupled receptor protein [Diplogelasinospora grovesii]